MRSKFSLVSSKKLAIAALTSISLGLLCAPAMAHHPFGGETPTNMVQGFLSGLGHPVIGLDHLAFVVTAGLLAVVFNRGLLIPVAFVITSLLGTIVHLLNVNLPAPEFFISASVLVFGLLLAMKNTLPAKVVMALAAAAGLFHGYAYGEAVVGAGMSSLLAYLIGFSTIQMAIALGVYATAKRLGHDGDQKALNLRFAGFSLAGIGAAFLSGVLLS
ncbi:HupE/UreJ family protein [Nodosilinea sp. E11]|uniref:HupE/UreJ family protein n=1 Tax=Nodosilinea sp. E11 TaxID=3037479 RepID=UPI002934F6AA|nr:HupE/UreJ family protein [Nodosilinea sp. E11]WOD39628.1 HupE/UreJ family protein [Nodosilinea sp. E11]